MASTANEIETDTAAYIILFPRGGGSESGRPLGSTVRVSKRVTTCDSCRRRATSIGATSETDDEPSSSYDNSSADLQSNKSRNSRRWLAGMTGVGEVEVIEVEEGVDRYWKIDPVSESDEWLLSRLSSELPSKTEVDCIIRDIFELSDVEF